MKLKRLVGVMAVAMAFMGGAGVANAVTPDTLLPGGNNFINGAFPVGLHDQLTLLGTVLASQTLSFSSASFTGTMFSEVISGDTNNPLGGLDFVWRVTNISGNDSGIHRVTIDGFGGVKTDVGFINDAPTRIDPTSATRSATLGATIGWNFPVSPSCTPSGCTAPTPGEIAPGTSTGMLIIYTDAKTFASTTAQLIDGSVATVATFAPVPEPENYAMMLSGLGLMGFVARRRKASKNTA